MIECPAKWSIGKYNAGILKTMVDSMKAEINKIESRQYNKKFMITFIKDIEYSLVESDIIGAFVSDDRDYKTMMKKMSEETDEHKEFLNRFLESRELAKD